MWKIITIAVISSILNLELAESISRSDVITRAQTWLNPKVPYSQTAYKDGYRTDCSGYVSMAWNTGTNYNTRNLNSITIPISKDDLKKGDILLRNGHVTIFEEWVDGTNQGKYKGYEQVGGRGTMSWNIPYPYWRNDNRYVPRRYVDIQD